MKYARDISSDKAARILCVGWPPSRAGLNTDKMGWVFLMKINEIKSKLPLF